MDIIIVCDDLFGLEVYSIIKEINGYIDKNNLDCEKYNVLGFLADEPSVFDEKQINLPVFCDMNKWKVSDKEYYVMGIKIPSKKEKAVSLLKEKGARFSSVVTPWTIMPDNRNIGEGCVISNYSFKDGAVFEPFVTMINVMSGASYVGEYSTIDSLSNITNAIIGKRVFIGSHAFLMEHIQIGDNCEIYTGSMVYSNVKSNEKIAGIPASKAKYRKITGESILTVK